MNDTDIYVDKRYCGHCNNDTMQECRDSGHERDSSNDYQECLACHWYKCGMNPHWEPPFEEKQEWENCQDE